MAIKAAQILYTQGPITNLLIILRKTLCQCDASKASSVPCTMTVSRFRPLGFFSFFCLFPNVLFVFYLLLSFLFLLVMSTGAVLLLSSPKIPFKRSLSRPSPLLNVVFIFHSRYLVIFKYCHTLHRMEAFNEALTVSN